MNFAESSALATQLHALGYQKANRGQVVDLCVINTCSVTDVADQKDRQAIRRIRRENPQAKVVVMGCYSQLKPQEVARIPGVDLVLGANDKERLLEWLTSLSSMSRISSAAGIPDRGSWEFHGACSEEGRTRHFLKVQDGCDYFCTYCTIPFARGRSRNASVNEIVQMARQSINRGAREIVLTGVNTGDFGHSTGETFLELLKSLDNLEDLEDLESLESLEDLAPSFRFRISSIEPNLLTDEILQFVAHSRHFCPHFHIPLQSGSDEVLHLMKRRYNRDFFSSKIARVHELMPSAFIGVDVMVGVRGETAECFEDMLRYLNALDVSQLHVFTYSERAGTRMLQIEPKVDTREAKRRSDIVHEISEQKLKAFYAKHCGEKGTVLWEEGTPSGSPLNEGRVMHGFTENYIRLSRPYDERLVNTFTVETI